MIETITTYIVGSLMGLAILIGALISTGVVLAFYGYGVWLIGYGIWRMARAGWQGLTR